MATGAMLSPRAKESFEDHDVYDFHDEDEYDAQATDEGIYLKLLWAKIQAFLRKQSLGIIYVV